jgi:PAS domain S-box-containing protein
MWLRSRYSFHTVLLTTMLTILLGGIAILGAVTVYSQRRNYETLSQALVEQTLNRVRDRLDELVKTAVDHAQLYPKLAPEGELTADDFPRLFEQLWATVEPHDELSYLGVGIAETGEYAMLRNPPEMPLDVRMYVRDAEHGPQIRDYRTTARGLELFRTQPWDHHGDPKTSYVLSKRPFFEQAAKAHRSIWTDRYLFWEGDDRGPIPGVTFATPVYSGGKLTLVWDIDFELQSLARFLERVQLDVLPGRVFIVEERQNGEWKLLAHPGFLQAAAEQSEFVLDPLAEGFISQLPGSYAEWEQRGSHTVRIAAEGKLWFATCATLQGPDRPRWMVCTLWPEGTLTAAPALSDRWLLGTLVLIAAAMSAATWVVARRVAEPLKHLEREAQRLADGDHRAVPPIEHGVSEIASLAATFNELSRRVVARETSLLQANTELRDSQQRLAAHIRRTPLAAIEFDRAGLILGWNDSAERIFGWTASEAIQRHYGLLLTGEVRPSIDDLWVNLVSLQGGLRSDNQNVTKDGRIIDCEWHNAPLIDDRGYAFGVASLVADVTERKRAEEDVRRLNGELEQRVAARTADLESALRELEAFSYSVSHDLRAPLRAIDGFGAALAEDCRNKLPPEGADYLQRIRASTRRMGELIDALLNLSRVVRQELHSETVDLSELARQACETLQHLDPARRVDVQIQPDLLAVCDRELLRIVLQNLLENAWKYTRATPQPRIGFGAVDSAAGRAYFVRDNGIGFDPAYAAKLFQPFQRLHRGEDYEGHGIGLATVHRILRKHGGEVRLESRPGAGATCWFTLGCELPAANELPFPP